MKRLSQNLLLLFGSLIISILVIELLMRLVYPPGSVFNLDEFEDHGPYQYYTPKRNEFGFREEEVAESVLTDEYTRILFLGDSFTFGHGIENGKDRFSDIIEERLNDDVAKSSDSMYHIYNAGIGATEPDEWVLYMEGLLPYYKPNYIFAVFFLRVGTDLCTSLFFY